MKMPFIGGTGCIGSEIAALAVLRPDLQLFLLNRGRRPAFTPPGVTSITADINDPAAVRAGIGDLRFDVLVDFIAYGVEDVERDLALFAGRFRQYVFISTAMVYRVNSRSEVIREDTACVGETVWSYALHKIRAEMRLHQERARSGLDFTIVRPAFTYNRLRLFHPVCSDDHQRVSWTLADRILKGKPLLMHDDGDAPCTVTAAEDFAKGFIGLLGNPAAYGEAFHIASDEHRTFNRVAEMLGEALGVPTRLCHIPAHTLGFELGMHFGEKLIHMSHGGILDSGKIRRTVPGFSCSIPLDEGLRRCVAWYREHPEAQIVDATWDADMDRIAATHGGWTP